MGVAFRMLSRSLIMMRTDSRILKCLKTAILICVVFACFTLQAVATGSNGAAASNLQPRSTSDLNFWRSMGALLLVLGGLLAASRYFKGRFSGPLKGLAVRRIRFIERYAIDQRRSLLLVAVDQRELLVGVGPDRITALMELKDGRVVKPGDVAEEELK